MDLSLIAGVIAGAGALGVVVWLLAQLGRVLVRIADALAAAAVVFLAVWLMVKAVVWAIRQVITHWRTSLTLLALGTWWHWWGWPSLTLTTSVLTEPLNYDTAVLPFLPSQLAQRDHRGAVMWHDYPHPNPGGGADSAYRAERMRQPLTADVVAAVADRHGVCVRPFTMEVGDLDTGELRYVPLPCGSTIESVCGPCARKARALRMAQCREGWHLTEEPTLEPEEPSAEQQAALTARADLVAHYQDAVHTGHIEDAEDLRETLQQADEKLRQLGVRGRLPSPDLPGKRPPKRSTRRRQDAPNLPTRRVAKTTLGREYAGRFWPSMFVTLTCDSYGRVHQDGTPINPDAYDYRRAARDAVHFASLVDRWWQNLRRVVRWEVQYFATVEPQRRAAPHLHTAIRGSIPHEVIRQVTAATYHQVWWPHHDHLLYTGTRLPVWEPGIRAFADPIPANR